MKKNTKNRQKNKKPLILIISAILGLIALFFVLMNTDFKEIFNFFKNTTFHLVITYIIIQLLLMITLTLRWATILKSQGHKKINLFRLNQYRLAGQAISFFTPTAKMGGDGIKTKIMSKRESLPYSKALSTVVIDNAVDLTTSAFFFIIGVIGVLLSTGIDSTTKLFLGLVLVAFITLLGIFNYRLFKGKKIVHGLAQKIKLFKIKKLKKIENEIKKFDDYLLKFYSEDKKYFLYTVLLSLISWFLMFVEYYTLGRMLGLNFDIWMIFLIVTLIGIAYLIPVPMALGSLELSQVSAFKLIGISTAAGIGLSFVVRAKDLFLAMWGAAIISFYGLDPVNSLNKAGIGDELEQNNKKITRTK